MKVVQQDYLRWQDFSFACFLYSETSLWKNENITCKVTINYSLSTALCADRISDLYVGH